MLKLLFTGLANIDPANAALEILLILYLMLAIVTF